jgi:hypothetical protein
MAAYRACEAVTDERTGTRYDFSRKSGLLFSQIIAPEGAPDWARDRSELWNRSEAANKRSDAVVAREIQLSLPHELSNVQRREVAQEFAQYMAERYEIAVDLCLHAPNREGDERNYHAHLLLCTRGFDAEQPTGLSKRTVRELDPIARSRAGSKNDVTDWRETWALMLNNALERANVRDGDGVQVVVDHRSYKDREIDLEPQLKEGPAATAKKRRGEETDRAEMNEAIKQRNEERQRMAAEIDAPELLKRQAQQITERGARDMELKEARPAPEADRRQARDITATEMQRGLIAANDNNKPAQDNKPNKPDVAARLVPMPWETADAFAKRQQEMRERVKNTTKPELKPKGPTFSY